MPQMHGGMVFRHGAIVRFPSPPPALPAHPIRVTCLGEPQVAIGDPLTRGEIIFNPQQLHAPCMVSPINGTVTGITPWENTSKIHRTMRYRTDRAHTPPEHVYDVTIDPGEQKTLPTRLEIEPPNLRTAESWLHALRTTGVWSEGGGRFNLIEQLAAALHQQPDTLMCVGIDSFAPYPDSSCLLDSFPDDVVLGTQILADIFSVKSMQLLASNNGTVVSRLKPSCRNFRVPLNVVNNIYPSADPTIVAWRFASGRRRLPHTVNPIEKGVVMVGPWTAIRIARWFTHRELDLVHPVLIGWPNASASVTPCYAMPGMPMGTLHGALAGHAATMTDRVILGNPLTGRAVQSPIFDNRDMLPVIPSDEHLISVLPPRVPQTQQPCISCGWCPDVCPTALRPIHLVNLIKRNKQPQYVRSQLDWCIECGLCSHVCPVHIPLAEMLRQASEVMQ